MGVTVDGARKRRGTKAAAKSTATKAVEEATPEFENPLVPNAVLQEMYQKMVELRLLAQHAQKAGHKGKAGLRLESMIGQEACRVSVTQGLGADDLVMDSLPGELMTYTLGARLPNVVRSIVAGAKGKKEAGGRVNSKLISTRLLPFVEEAEARLFAGLGASLLLKRMKRTDAVVIYVEHEEVSRGAWHRALMLAALQELPVIFVVLPAPSPRSKSGKIKLRAQVVDIAHDCKVPGIAVDASDAVALYRVAQESLWRIRSGGGAVLIEAIPFAAAGHQRRVADPIVQMRASLLQRRVSSEASMTQVEQRFAKRIEGVEQN